MPWIPAVPSPNANLWNEGVPPSFVVGSQGWAYLTENVGLVPVGGRDGYLYLTEYIGGVAPYGQAWFSLTENLGVTLIPGRNAYFLLSENVGFTPETVTSVPLTNWQGWGVPLTNEQVQLAFIDGYTFLYLYENVVS